jgi:hypothetical protein
MHDATELTDQSPRLRSPRNDDEELIAGERGGSATAEGRAAQCGFYVVEQEIAHSAAEPRVEPVHAVDVEDHDRSGRIEGRRVAQQPEACADADLCPPVQALLVGEAVATFRTPSPGHPSALPLVR